MKRLMIAVLMVAWAVLGLPRAGLAQDAPPVTYERYDVAIDVKPDGSFAVQEIQQIRFDGEFTQAFAEIPLAYTTRIDDVSVYEGDTAYTAGGDGPGTFTTEYDGDNLAVDWTFEQTQPGDVRTFMLAYTVAGGLWIYPDGDLLEWRAVPADRSGVPVQASRVTVTLPADPASGLPVPARTCEATAFGAPATAQSSATARSSSKRTSHPRRHGVAGAGRLPARPRRGRAAGLADRRGQRRPGLSLQGAGHRFHHQRRRLGGRGGAPRICGGGGALRQGVHTHQPHRHGRRGRRGRAGKATKPSRCTEELCDYCYWVSQTPRAAWLGNATIPATTP